MAAPEFVPVDRTVPVRGYTSPPRLRESWWPERPGEVVEAGQPRGRQLGNQGPDQGYALAIARHFEGRLVLTAGEHERDALAGAVGVALKRASIFGRAPVVHDLTMALTVWGFLGEAPAELVELRRELFEEVAHPNDYASLAHIVDLVPESTLRMTPAQAKVAHRAGWRSLLGDVSTP